MIDLGVAEVFKGKRGKLLRGLIGRDVAAFDVGPGRTASVGETNFKPLQAIQ